MFLTKTKRSKYYQLVYVKEGKRSVISTKAATKIEAQQFIKKFLDTSEKTNTTLAVLELSEFRDQYISFVNHSRSKCYIRSIRLSFEQLMNFIGDIKLNQVNAMVLDKFIIQTFSNAPHSASLYYRTLKAAFSKAVAWGHLPNNLFKKIKVDMIF